MRGVLLNSSITFDESLAFCPVCKSEHIKYKLTDYCGIKIDYCLSCQSRFMNPQYTDKYLQKFYQQYQQTDFQHHRYADATIPRLAKHEDNLSLIEKHGSIGKFLSIGSGNGLDLQVAKHRGWEAEGYEVDKEFTKKLSKETGCQIHTGSFTDLNLPTDYDCIYMNHVIEHPKNPGDYLHKINDLLHTGGLLYIATPNIQSASAQMKKVLDLFRLRSKKASYYDTWQHLVYFNPRQLSRVLSTHFGFETLFIGADGKKVVNGNVKHSYFERFTLQSSFRILLRKR